MAPRKKQKAVKKNPVRRTRQTKKLASSCTNLKQPNRPKLTAKKSDAICPHCNGAGRIAKKKVNKNPTSYFPYFFQHVCKRAREGKVVQLRQITMKKAAACWNALTDEQRGDFIMKAQRTLGISGGRPKSSGSQTPSSSRCAPKSEDHQDTGPSISGNQDAFIRDSRRDVKPTGSCLDVRQFSPNDPKPKPRNDEESQKTNDTSKTTSPFGKFDHLRRTGNYF